MHQRAIDWGQKCLGYQAYSTRIGVDVTWLRFGYSPRSSGHLGPTPRVGANLESHLYPCEQEHPRKFEAVLSWGRDPSNLRRTRRLFFENRKFNRSCEAKRTPSPSDHCSHRTIGRLERGSKCWEWGTIFTDEWRSVMAVRARSYRMEPKRPSK